MASLRTIVILSCLFGLGLGGLGCATELESACSEACREGCWLFATSPNLTRKQCRKDCNETMEALSEGCQQAFIEWADCIGMFTCSESDGDCMELEWDVEECRP